MKELRSARPRARQRRRRAAARRDGADDADRGGKHKARVLAGLARRTIASLSLRPLPPKPKPSVPKLPVVPMALCTP
eukprot:2009497-Pleurochrysis_carterae.AAC.1